MSEYEKILSELQRNPQHWLVTGCAGFIGSHLVQKLLSVGQKVTGLDNLSTGKDSNLKQIEKLVTSQQWSNFTFIKGDICSPETCAQAVQGASLVLHQAALGSVPRSIEYPAATHAANVTGFLNMAIAARDAKVSRFVYASSSSVYGDAPELPKIEDRIGAPLSPYAASKLMNEQYAAVFARCYGMSFVGLRYFNVFGPRQDSNGMYAAVVPKWVEALKKGEPCVVYGDGETSRDFCHVDNAVQANILAAMSANKDAVNTVYNVSVGERTSLNELYRILAAELATKTGNKLPSLPSYQPFRAGDIRHSQASIERAQRLLGYAPTMRAIDGLKLLANS